MNYTETSMANNSKKYWQHVYDNNKPLDSKPWLCRYDEYLGPGKKVLDLGCGYGNDTRELIALGCDVISTDLIQGMVDKTLADVAGSKGFAFDMENDDWAVFVDNQFDVVVAGLSLHYFSAEVTTRIIQEIKRILLPGGILLARVNSVNDAAHGAGDGERIEDNFYIDRVRGNNKRYFDRRAVEKFFSPLGKLTYKEVKDVFNNNTKVMFEIVVKV